MDWNSVFFVILPYISIFVAVIVTIYRAIYRPFSISSLSSQLLERKQLFWGSISFHWGITIILLGHLLALLVPGGLIWWNSVPVRLYLLELTGFALALWTLAGLLLLGLRRVSVARVRAVTSPMDVAVWFLLLFSVATGIDIALRYRFGTYWFTAILTPYLWSVLTFRPDVTLVQPLPLTIKLHIVNFFLLLLVFPFSRLVHIIAYPLSYLIRPWQIVIYPGYTRPASHR